jgi:hypothetical protein
MKKTLIKSSLFLLLSAFSLRCSSFIFAEPPSIDKDFLSHLQEDTVLMENVKADKTFAENIKEILYPVDAGNSGALGNALRTLAIGLLLVYLVYAGAQLLISGKKAEDLQEATRSL